MVRVLLLALTHRRRRGRLRRRPVLARRLAMVGRRPEKIPVMETEMMRMKKC
jgi:hypothetical protein